MKFERALYEKNLKMRLRVHVRVVFLSTIGNSKVFGDSGLPSIEIDSWKVGSIIGSYFLVALSVKFYFVSNYGLRE